MLVTWCSWSAVLRTVVLLLVARQVCGLAPPRGGKPAARLTCSTRGLCSTFSRAPSSSTSSPASSPSSSDAQNSVIGRSEGNDFLQRNCFCQPDCSNYQDCCKDAAEDKHERPNHHLKPHMFKCQLLLHIDNFRPVYVINACPSGFKDLLINQKCSRADDDQFYNFPVYTRTGNRIYRNQYCAFCHKEMDNIQFFKMQLNSKREWLSNNVTEAFDTLKQAIDNSTHDYSVQYVWDKELFQPRYCKQNVNTCLNTANKKLARKCRQNSVNYVYRSVSQTFRNKHCARCNNVTNYSCKDPRLNFDDFGQNELSKLPSFSLIFDFMGSNSIVGKKVEMSLQKRTCDADHIYDPLGQRCRRVYCPSGHRYVDDECRAEDGGKELHKPTDGSESSVVTSTPTSLDPSEGGEGVNSTTETADNRVNGDVLSRPVDFVGTTPTVNIGQSQQKPVCPMIALNSSDYSILENGTLLHFQDHSLHSSGSFMITYDNGQELMLICAPSYNETFVFKKKFSGIQGIVSFVCTVISLVCLLVHFVVYVFFSSLRKNLPGKLQMCLVFSLFTGQLLFLLNAEDLTPVLCTCIGVAMHFFFLASFFWMNVLAFDVWRTFGRITTTIISNRGSNKRLIFYNLYAWMSAGVLVCFGVSVDEWLAAMFSQLEVIAPRYGHNDLCWINNKMALIALFVVPSAILILINSVFFVMTVISLYRISQETDLVRRERRSQVFLYVKMSILMGGTWTVSYIAGMVDRPFLWYIFIVLNSLQGFYMFISFVCTKKVLSLMRGLCGAEKKKYATVGTGHYNGHKHHLTTSSRAQTKDTYVQEEDAMVISSHETCI